jgi:acetyltransferase-like isoleucine patch superfamily enzyme
MRLRAIDRALQFTWLPNRVDRDARVSPTALVVASRLHGAVRVGDYARLHRVLLSGPITIGDFTSLWGPRIYVYARPHPVQFGNFCSIGRDVSVYGYGHDPARISTYYMGRNVLGGAFEDEIVSHGPTAIEHDVWIGAGVHVLAGSTIGTGAIVGAGSVVTNDIPPYAVAVGAPAAVVRYRFDDELIGRLLASRWWTWTREEIRARASLFSQPLTQDLLDEYLDVVRAPNEMAAP